MKTILIMILLAAASVHCRPVYSGGTGGPEPSHVVCLIFDMSTKQGKVWSGWHPVSEQNRVEVGLLVKAGAAEWMEAQTADCYERHLLNTKLGQKVRIEYMEWWRWKEPKRRTSHE
jgi:hypothetical protein